MENYYEMMRKQEYDKLLDKEIQLENAKNNALKHTNTQLSAQGLNSQGYGSSVNSGVYGRYLDAFERSEQNYQNNIDNINFKEHEQIKKDNEEKFQQIVGLMSSSDGNIDRVNQLLVDNGLGSIDTNGNFVFNEKAPDFMNDNDLTQLKYIYGIQNDANDFTNHYGSLEALGKGTYIDKQGDVKTLGETYANQLKTIWHYASNGKFKNGDMIRIHGEPAIFLKWTKNGFKLGSESEFNALDKGKQNYVTLNDNNKVVYRNGNEEVNGYKK